MATMDFSRSTDSGSDIPGNITTSRIATAGTTLGRERVLLLISSIVFSILKSYRFTQSLASALWG